MPNVGKPWSTENLAQTVKEFILYMFIEDLIILSFFFTSVVTNVVSSRESPVTIQLGLMCWQLLMSMILLFQQTPWPPQDSSPPLLWSKAASLTEETFRPQQHQRPLPSQHFSDPFLPRENYWLQGRGPTAAPAYLHPSHARFNSNLQRQRAFDNVQSHGMLGNLPRGHSTTSIQPCIHPGIAGYGKQSQPVPQSHLQVPGHFAIGHGSHHSSNPRFQEHSECGNFDTVECTLLSYVFLPHMFSVKFKKIIG